MSVRGGRGPCPVRAPAAVRRKAKDQGVSSLSCAQVNVCVPISYLQSCGVRVHVCDCVSTVSVLSVCIAAAVHEACACRVRVPVRGRCRQDTSEEVRVPNQRESGGWRARAGASCVGSI